MDRYELAAGDLDAVPDLGCSPVARTGGSPVSRPSR
jgi:hypothetical protein